MKNPCLLDEILEKNDWELLSDAKWPIESPTLAGATVSPNAAVSPVLEAMDAAPNSREGSQTQSIVALVVDDSPIDRALIAGLVQKQLGINVRIAADGAAALESIAAAPPDLVLTDLQMPEMDGLSLVESVRLNYPYIPTILMTAHGSEEIAFAALKVGAANYVNKRNLAARLAETVRDVLAVSQQVRQHQRLNECWCATHFEFELENDASLIPALVNHLQAYQATIRRRDETELMRVGIALHEALRNAIHHGNLELDSSLRTSDPDAYYRLADERRHSEPFRARRVYLQAQESRQESRYTISDEGSGFNRQHFDYDPTAAMNLDKPSGRGLFLIRTFMDEVVFNDCGNQITMVHRREEGNCAHRMEDRYQPAQPLSS